MGIGFADLSLGISLVDGEVTGAVEVEIGIERFSIEAIDGSGVFLRDVAVSHGLADDGAVLAFGERIVIGLARPRLVNSTRSFSSSSAVLWLTYSDPESEWTPRIANGKPSRSRAITGSR